jgi:membrane-bound lytic murein transglycosylase D
LSRLRVQLHLSRDRCRWPVLAFGALLAGCTTLPGTEHRVAAEKPAPDMGYADEIDGTLLAAITRPVPGFTPPPVAPKIEIPQDIWSRLRAGYGIGDVDHPRVEEELKRLLRHPPALQSLLERSRPFLGYVLARVEARGLPSEIALLPAVESAYKPFAYSPDGAAGLWQFMPATGKHFGLRIDWWQDGRRDPAASTRAALDYIEHLRARFDGDTLLALAAYNAGGTKVARAVKKNERRGRPGDYWSLDLPRETDQYVPRLLALARIIEQPELFGIELPDIENASLLAQIETGGQVDLQIVAELAGIPLEDLITLNAGFNRTATHPDGPHRLLVPCNVAEELAKALADLPPEKRLRWQRHAVRAGDTLDGIARRYDVSVAAIRKANGISGSLIRTGDDLAIPLSEGTTARVLGAAYAGGERLRYRVRRGDSLYVIARRFQVSVADLRRWNGISGRLIKPGQQLTVYLRNPAATL